MTPSNEIPAKAFVERCLIGLAAALLLVGLVSGTVLRHIVQILPMGLAFVVLRRRPAWGAYAAFPIFVFWIGIVVLIWLFLLGLSRIASGHYTPIEIVSTFVMAACSILGSVKSVSLGRSTSIANRLAMFVLFAFLQLVAMWVSFLKPIANR